MFEVKPKTNFLLKLGQKIQDFLTLGMQVGVLVDREIDDGGLSFACGERGFAGWGCADGAGTTSGVAGGSWQGLRFEDHPHCANLYLLVGQASRLFLWGSHAARPIRVLFLQKWDCIRNLGTRG